TTRLLVLPSPTLPSSHSVSPAEQAQQKVVLPVEPGVAEGQASILSQGTNTRKGIFVRIFGMDGLASGKADGLRCFGNGHMLGSATAQVHLNASVLLVVEGEMGKVLHGEIRPEFTVHPV